jgi:hypothetical protein
MKKIRFIFIFITVYNIWNIYNFNFSELGIAPCTYLGEYDNYGYYCPLKPMDPSSLPTNCTSFVYDAELLFDDQSATDLNSLDNCKLKLLLILYNYKLCFKPKSDTMN